jgi:hypothetical protein
MGDEAINTSWAKALAVYDWLIENGWPHIPAFRALVVEISRLDETSGLTAVTSHETLIVSPYTAYPDWLEGRHVRLHPLRDGTVRVDKVPQRFDRHPTETWTLSLQETRDRIALLFSDL